MNSSNFINLDLINNIFFNLVTFFDKASCYTEPLPRDPAEPLLEWWSVGDADPLASIKTQAVFGKLTVPYTKM